MNKKTTFFILILILLLGAFLRLYKLADMAHFEFDQEYTANFAYSVLKIYPIQMIGQGLSVPGLFMGPIYFYLLVPFFAIFNLHPIGGFIGSSFLGLVNVLIYFWIGKKMFGEKIGLTLAFLRATLFSLIIFDWTMSPAFQADGVVLITWYCLYNFFKGKTKFIIPIGFLFGLFTSFHPILFPFYLVFMILEIIKRIIPTPKQIIACIALFLIPVSPLIRFEYLHSFWEVRQLLDFLKIGSPSQVPRDLLKLAEIIRIQFESPAYYLTYNFEMNIVLPITLITFTLFLYFIVKKIGFFKDSLHRLMLVTMIFSFTIYFFFLPTHITEYYLFAPAIIFIFYMIACLGFLKINLQTKILPIICLIILFINLEIFYSEWTQQTKYNLEEKDNIVKEIVAHQEKGSEFFVSYIMPYRYISGFDYLFKLYDRVPSKDSKPPIYNIVFPKSSVVDSLDFTSGNIGLILPKK